MTQINMLEAKTQLSKLVEAVESGAEAEIVIARNGKPAAKLVPITTPRRRTIGLYDGVYPDMSLEDFNAHDAEIAAMFLGEAKPVAQVAKPSKRRKS
jgi:prevent-host-death family protein